MEFRFAHVDMFQWLLLIPAIIVIVVVSKRFFAQRITKAFGEKTTPFLISSISLTKRRWKLFLQLAVIAFFVFSLARPQAGKSEQKLKSEGVEVMLLVDVSQSMLAEDVKPSRLELAKKELGRFIDFGGGDRIGLVAFAGSAVTLSPMTNDTSALNMFLESLGPDLVSSQGTYFQRALELALNAFEKGGVEESDEHVATRVILLASDGEDNEKGAIEYAEKLKEKGIRIFSLGFGTEKGGAIPIRDRRGQLKGYRKDKDGKVVLTKTRGTVLKNLAKTTGGGFYHVTFGSTIMSKVKADLGRLQQSNFENAKTVNYDERYQLYLLLGILLALIELFLGDRKAEGRLWKGRFEVSER